MHPCGQQYGSAWLMVYERWRMAQGLASRRDVDRKDNRYTAQDEKTPQTVAAILERQIRQHI